MEEAKRISKINPGLEEAIHPEIGNEALWSENDHVHALRAVDPLKALDNRLIEGNIREKVLIQWNQIDPPPAPKNHEASEFAILNEQQSERDLSISPLESITTEIELKPDPATESGSLSQEMDLPVQEKLTPDKKVGKKKDKQEGQASKRIRKVAEKIKKEEEELFPEKMTPTTNLKESNLSPFTLWLKGLTGSEYVHPYEDDFALSTAESEVGGGVSETFADLLASQGYKDQAIAMYNKLIEKFPEKSRFFAAKIEALQ